MSEKPLNAQGSLSDAPFFYTNVVSVSVGPFDVTMDFGYQSPESRVEATESGDEPAVEPLARIAMSHNHAKSMIPILAGLVAKFETNVGNIPTPGFEQKSKE